MAHRQTRSVTVKRESIRKYQRLLDVQADKAADYVGLAIDSYMRANPDASVAQVRKFTFELMQAALPNFTDLAETLSCEFMESLAESYGWDDVKPEIINTTDYRLVDKRLHYLAGHLADGDEERFKKEVVDVTKFYIRRSAQDAMIKNCDRLKIRYARVPSGYETCPFCFMLASRGFVYTSEEKAGLRHKFHNHCNCTIVPGARGRTKIDGYDPQGMADRWEQCAKSIGSQDPNEVMKEVATRDWHWLYTGEVPKQDYSEKTRESYGEHLDKTRYDRDAFGRVDNEWRDLFTHDVLRNNGFRIKSRLTKNDGGSENIDIDLNGSLCELKAPEAVPRDKARDQYQFVYNNVRDARHKFEKRGTGRENMRIVFSNRYTGFEGDLEIEVLNRFRTEVEKQGFTEALFITKDGNVVRVL